MERELLFGLSATTDVEYQAALQALRLRQQAGWRLYDVSEDVDQGLPVGVFNISKDDFERRILWGLSAETSPEFRAAIEELRALQAQQWEVYDADRGMDAGRTVGIIKIKKT